MTGGTSPSGALADTTPAVIDRVCRVHALSVAIRFAPDRVVVGGPTSALADAAVDAVQVGATTVRLALTVASHMPWMARAVEPFARRLEALPFARPCIALVCNHEGGVAWDSFALKRALAQQMAETVRWDDRMDAIRERDATCVPQMGPGTTLSRLWRARHPRVPARSVDEFMTPRAITRWVEGALA